MKRTTVFLPEPLERDLRGFSRREGKPVAWFVREALTEYVASRRRATRLPSFVGAGSSRATDVAERHEELLWRDPHGDAGRRRPRRRSSRQAPGKKR